MHFEGPEKKLEVLFQDVPMPRDDRAFWQKLVTAANAEIISEIHTDQIDAYLLSESSLFVQNNRILMITCGRTTLVDVAEPIFARFPKEKAAFLIYERKNEFFPEKQPTSFAEDAERLNAILPGESILLGSDQSQHISLFQTTAPYTPADKDMTLEILMQGMPKARCDLFRPESGLNKIHEITRIPDILPGFAVDAHIFAPFGYSMNAVRGHHYFTIHVTPQSPCTYVSFETNFYFGDDQQLFDRTIRNVLYAFEPERYNILFFQKDKKLKYTAAEDELRRSRDVELECGFATEFYDYIRSTKTITSEST